MKFKKFKYFTLLMCVMLLGINAYAQRTDEAITVSGKVVNKNNSPVEGVSILIQEAMAENKTAADGSFTIEVLISDIIVFEKEGYLTVRKSSRELEGATVVLTESLIDAGDNDNVYIPFGVRKKREVSASINSISGSALPQLPLPKLSNLLAGRLPGLYQRQLSGSPAQEFTYILLRGRTSFNSNQSPLFLVDGVERPFDDLDINEIESVSVLKDAASLTQFSSSQYL